MTMYFEEKVVMCALLLLFRKKKKAKKEDVGLSFNQPKTAFRPVSCGFALRNVRIRYVYKHVIIFVLYYYVDT